MPYERSPRVRNVPKNHALARKEQKKLKNNDENYLLSPEHLKSCFNKLRTTAGQAPGPDGLTFNCLNDKKWHDKLRWLASQIKSRKYHPGPTKIVKVKKDNGTYRKIRIQNITDRVASRAALEALYETIDSKFVNWSYGFRKNRSYKDILENIKNDYSNGCEYIAKLDIVKAFDHVNIRRLRTLIEKLSLRSELHDLVIGIIYQGINEESIEDNPIGITQGNSLSTLLFNYYIHTYHDKLIDPFITKHLRAYRYADDFVYFGQNRNDVKNLMQTSQELLLDNELTYINSEIININIDKLNLLGLTVGKIQPNILISLSDVALHKLILRLDEALTDNFPTRLQRLVVKGWLEATSIVNLLDQDKEKLRIILDNYGIPMEI